MDIHQIIITIASVITALGVIFGAVFAFHNWLLKREKNDTDIKVIKGRTININKRRSCMS